MVNFERHRNLHQRQAPVLHREPGHLRIHHAVGLQPAAVHAPRRRSRRRRRGLGRHHRGAQAQRQHRRDQVRPVRRRRRRRRVGRTFSALRVVRDFSTQNLGLHGDPRRSAVSRSRRHRVRHRSQLAADRALERPHALVRQRHRPGRRDNSRRPGATVWADYEMDHGWRQQWIAMHFGNDAARSTTPAICRATAPTTLHWQVNRRFTELPEPSRYASKDWRWRVSTDHNDHGAAARPPVPHEPREPAAQRQLRVRADQHQQRRLRRSAHARQRLALAAAELQQLFRVPAPAQRATGATRSRAKRSAAGSPAIARSAIACIRAAVLRQRRVQHLPRAAGQPHPGLAGVATATT